MKRKEKIYYTIKDLSQKITYEDFKDGVQGITTEEVSEKIQIGRNNVSKELNILVAEKKVIKVLGRPVYYLDKAHVEKTIGVQLDNEIFQSFRQILSLRKESTSEDASNIFHQMIGSSESLKHQIKKIESAVLYPPNGLHTLLIGATGVGKSMLAELMYKYALDMKVIHENAGFVMFNCAEYAENPQLLSSQLFGYIKGAFTGAESDKDGLIDKANGGFLFLDEIHRLPSEGQEMLFTLIDKNLYRRVGEIELKRKANVRIIGATTKALNSSLLDTFIRRIPITIELPSLENRPLSERLELIYQFIIIESERINADILVKRDVIMSLLLYDCHGNIGQLKSDIQLICARGYLDYMTQSKKMVEITMALLPNYIYNSFFDSKKRSETDNILQVYKKSEYIFSKEGNTYFDLDDPYNKSETIYEEINRKVTEYTQKGYSDDIINKILDKDIQKYVEELEQKFNIKYQSVRKDELFKLINPHVYYAVEKALKLAEKNLERNFSNKIYISLSMHINELMKDYGSKRYQNIEDIQSIVSKYPKEYKAAHMIKDELERTLKIDLAEEEVIFITMFLFAVKKDKCYDSKRIGILVICHGENTATSIADVANKLLCTNICHAINMPLDQKAETTLNEAIEVVKSIDQKKGVLLMIDMGALTTFSEIITEKTGIKTKFIEMVSTPIVLEAMRKCLFTDIELNGLVEELKLLRPYTRRAKVINQKEPKMKYIFVSCLTGKGTAHKIAKLIEDLDYVKTNNIKVVSMNKTEYEANKNNFDGQILAVAGTVNFKIPDAIYFPTEKIITKKGLAQFESMLKHNISEPDKNDDVLEKTLLQALEDMLVFLNPQKVYRSVKTAYKLSINEIEATDSIGLETRFIIHCSCAIERLIRNESFFYQEANKKINENKHMYKVLAHNFKNVEEIFGITIPDTEICYMIDLINTN